MLLMPWYRRLLAAADPSMDGAPGYLVVRRSDAALGGLDILFFAGMAPVMAMSVQAVAAGGEPAPRLDIFVFYWTMIIIGSYLFYGRMGLALPAAAAESDHSYGRSWAMTRDNGWRIGFAVLLCWLPLQLLVGTLREPLATENPTLAIQYLDAALGALLPHRQRTPGHGGIRAILPGANGPPA